METIMTHRHKLSILVYLILAMGITWLYWIPGLLIGSQQGYVMPNFDTYAALFEAGFTNTQHLLLAIAFQLGVYGPLIGSLVATWMDGGRDGLMYLWRHIAKWYIGGRWYLIAFVIILVITGLPVLIFSFVGEFTLSKVAISYVLFVLVAQLFTSGLGEEPGWRGFLLPRLQAHFEDEKSIWILGLIWAIWHYPLVIIQTLSVTQNVTVPQMVITIIMSLVGMTMSQIGITFIYVWLYNRTQSIFLMIVSHALSNTLSNWLTSFLVEPQVVTHFLALMLWIEVIFLQKRLGNEKFPGVALA